MRTEEKPSVSRTCLGSPSRVRNSTESGPGQKRSTSGRSAGSSAAISRRPSMPVVFTFLFLNFPAGLVVYWLVNNVLSITQQWWMMRGNKKAA